MPGPRRAVGAFVAFFLTTTWLSGVAPVDTGAAAPAVVAPPGAPAKPFSAGTIQIDPEALATGSVEVVADPAPGFTDASVIVTGAGDASVDAGREAVGATPSVVTGTVVVAEGATAADPAAAVRADAARSSVTATLRAVDAGGTSRVATDTVWVDEFAGETLVSDAGELDLRLQRVGVLEATGSVTAEQADALREEIRGGGATTRESSVPGTCAGLCVGGTVLWTDSAGGTHPVDRAPVQIREENADGDDVITTVLTDGTGHYTALVDAVDPEGGDRDLYVRVRANGPGATTVHYIESATDDDIPSGSEVTQDLTANNRADNNTAFAIQASLVFAYDYLVDRNGAPFPPVPVVFPDRSGSFFDGTRLHLLRLDRWDWDVSLHEYGHYLAPLLDIEDNPGGPHSGSDNLSDTRGSKSIGIRLAFGEGWPTFFAVSSLFETANGLGIPRVGDTKYQDTEDQVITDDLEVTAGARLGEDNELTVTNILWDLFDAVDDGLDTTTLGAQGVWDGLDDNDPVTLSQAYRGFSPGQGDTGVNCVFTQMNVSPRVNGARVTGVTLDSPRPRLSWTRGNGGSHRNNSFELRFRAADGTSLFSTARRPTTSFVPSAARWRSLLQRSGGTLRVAVIARQTDAPVTGPYRSCERRFLVT